MSDSNTCEVAATVLAITPASTRSSSSSSSSSSSNSITEPTRAEARPRAPAPAPLLPSPPSSGPEAGVTNGQAASTLLLLLLVVCFRRPALALRAAACLASPVFR
ncbi:hypothetical protein ACSSS7_005008 [Eimeria intestinalis]